MKKYLKSAAVLLLVLITTFSMLACAKPPMVSVDELTKAEESGKAEGEITLPILQLQQVQTISRLQINL